VTIRPTLPTDLGRVDPEDPLMSGGFATQEEA
jgi:hypothetical protein